MTRRVAVGSLAATMLRRAFYGESPAAGWNEYRLPIKDGEVVLDFISPSSFRFIRRWGPVGNGRALRPEGNVLVSFTEGADWAEFSTRYLRIRLEKATQRLYVWDRSGELLFADGMAAVRTEQGVLWERLRREGESFRGLGPTSKLGRAGEHHRVIHTEIPFLVSNLGYGEYFRGKGVYRYELGDSRLVLAPPGRESEYIFYYGPTTKEILEEHVAVEPASVRAEWATFRCRESYPVGSLPLPEPAPDWGGLSSLVEWVQEAGYSAVLFPAVNIGVWRRAAREVRDRARALALFLPVIYGVTGQDESEAKARSARERWVPFLVSYGYEARERGLPLVRPLGMQYPKDSEAGKHQDEFMLGDDLLVAPVLDGGRKRKVYLPAGQWTEWHSNLRYAGRRVVEIEAPAHGILLFAKNGSLVPVAQEKEPVGMVAHYFPRLAGEFFLYEEGDGALSQLHAAPAGEWMRLEIEPARERTWEWVIHHVERPQRVWSGARDYRLANSRRELGPGMWWYDRALKNLHVQVRAVAGSHHVVYASF